MENERGDDRSQLLLSGSRCVIGRFLEYRSDVSFRPTSLFAAFTDASTLSILDILPTEIRMARRDVDRGQPLCWI